MAKNYKPQDVVDLLRRCSSFEYQTANNSTTIHFTLLDPDVENVIDKKLVNRAMGIPEDYRLFTGASIKVVGGGQVILTVYTSFTKVQFKEWKLPIHGLFNNKLVKALNLFNQHFINKVLNESK